MWARSSHIILLDDETSELYKASGNTVCTGNNPEARSRALS